MFYSEQFGDKYGMRKTMMLLVIPGCQIIRPIEREALQRRKILIMLLDRHDVGI